MDFRFKWVVIVLILGLMGLVEIWVCVFWVIQLELGNGIWIGILDCFIELAIGFRVFWTIELLIIIYNSKNRL